MRKPGRRILFLTLLLLLLPAVAPTVAADHSYSHRYLILGAVTYGDGTPAPNQTVRLETHGYQPEGPCNPGISGSDIPHFGPQTTRPVSAEDGTFVFCHHMHALAWDHEATARLSVLGADNETLAVREVRLDHHMRVSFVRLMLPQAAPGDANDPGLLVLGRVWTPAIGTVREEGVRVYGTAHAQVPVEVTLRRGDGTREVVETVTNNYGDYAARFADPRGRGDTLLVEAAGMLEVATPVAAEGSVVWRPMHRSSFQPQDALVKLVAQDTADGACAWRAWDGSGTTFAPGANLTLVLRNERGTGSAALVLDGELVATLARPDDERILNWTASDGAASVTVACGDGDGVLTESMRLSPRAQPSAGHSSADPDDAPTTKSDRDAQRPPMPTPAPGAAAAFVAFAVVAMALRRR